MWLVVVMFLSPCMETTLPAAEIETAPPLAPKPSIGIGTGGKDGVKVKEFRMKGKPAVVSLPLNPDGRCFPGSQPASAPGV